MTYLEISANVVVTLSVWLAARNAVHTWTTGIVGSVLFGIQFFQVQLYAEATLQIFFIATSVVGWWQWRESKGQTTPRPVTSASTWALVWMALAALTVTIAYGALLHRFTDAYMSFIDAGVLAMSVVAQCLLMQRKLQTWPWWLAVNTLSIPLFASRGLWLTAALYAVYWFNAWYGWWNWRREARAQETSLEPRTQTETVIT